MTKPTIYATFRYADAPAAIEWFKNVLGFTEHAVYPGEEAGTIAHAQMQYGDDMIMLGSARDGDEPRGPSVTYIVADDVDAHYERAVAAGANVTSPLVDQDYGSREYAVTDPGGNIWSVGTYQPATE